MFLDCCFIFKLRMLTLVVYRMLQIFKNILFPLLLFFLLRYSVFGKALVNSLRGTCCKPESEFVSAIDIFRFVHNHVTSTIERYNARNIAEYKPEPDTEPTPPAPFIQSPVMFVPENCPQFIYNPICYRCGPPAAPDKPYVS